MEQDIFACELSVGDAFSSYKELQEAVTCYENARRVQFWRRDTKRLHRAAPKVFEVIKNYPQLEYCSIRFSCVHGGQAFRPKNIFGPRQRKSRGTWKQDCKAEILVGLNEEKNALVVKKIVDEHNHDIPTEEVFQQLSRTRRNVEKLKTSRPKMHEKMMKLEDKQNILSNLVRVNSLARSNNLKKVANLLRVKYRCRVALQDDGEDKVIGFFFQDYHMRKCFDMFPEILLIDGTYVLQNITCCIYIFSVENSLGTTDVVGVGVLTTKKKESVQWVMEKFKEKNPSCDKTVIVVSDRFTSELDITLQYFPNAAKLICPSHALQTFKKDTLSSKILNVIPSEADTALNFFHQLMKARSVEEYQTVLEDMEDNISYPIVEYFINTWHDLRNEWVKGFNPPLWTCINTKLDSPNSKLRSSTANCKTFTRFVENFFLVTYLRRNELRSELTRVSTMNHPDEHTSEYSHHLSSYAIQKIRQFLSQMDDLEFDVSNEDSDVICDSDGCTFVVSEISCNCDFFTLMRLPCRHLLAYRNQKKVDLFDEYLFSERWTKSYVKGLFDGFGRRVGETQEGLPTQDLREKRFETAHYVCLSLAGLCSEVPDDVFEGRVRVLEGLRDCWQRGDDAAFERVARKERVVVIDHDYYKAKGGEEYTN